MKYDWTDDEQNMRVVIVDDDPAICDTLESDCKDLLGLRWITNFTDPKEALDYFSAHHAEVDVVLLDLNMPEIDGIQVFTRLSEINNTIQVLVISAYADQDTVIQTLTTLGLPINRLITKPVEPATLAKGLREAYQWVRNLRRGLKP